MAKWAEEMRIQDDIVERGCYDTKDEKDGKALKIRFMD